MGFQAPFCAGLPRHLDSSVDRAQHIDLLGSAALVLGSILVAASVCFALVALVQFRFV